MIEIVKSSRNRLSAKQSIVLHDKLYERDGRICMICGQPAKHDHRRGGMQVDHKIPISKGGYENEDNLQMAHPYCNQKKGNR